jgi:DNA-binding NarL/FixJ family response regulator
MPTTVLIADDHAVTAEGTRAAIASMNGFDVVGVVANGIEAISGIKRLRPDCAVLDIAMPGASGLEVLIEARRWSPETRIAIVTGNPSPGIFRQLVDAGAQGIFLKSASVDELRDGIRDVASGRRVVGSGVERVLAVAASSSELSRRETEVLQCVARGLSNTGIAERLGISPKTVDTHRTSLMRKLGAHSTATLLVRAIRDGLIDVCPRLPGRQS